MKYGVRMGVALLAFVLGITASLFWSALRCSLYQSTSLQEPNPISPIKIEGEVYFRFLECAGKKSVFVLENQTDHPIYARVQRVDYWKEYEDADVELGVHFIESKPSYESHSEDVRSVWDAPLPFKTIRSYSGVRYGVDLPKAEREYRVRVPYLEDGEFARRLNENFAFMLKQDFEGVKASWREVTSDVVMNTCQ
jgi:hypothetical protein